MIGHSGTQNVATSPQSGKLTNVQLRNPCPSTAHHTLSARHNTKQEVSDPAPRTSSPHEWLHIHMSWSQATNTVKKLILIYVTIKSSIKQFRGVSIVAYGVRTGVNRIRTANPITDRCLTAGKSRSWPRDGPSSISVEYPPIVCYILGFMQNSWARNARGLILSM